MKSIKPDITGLIPAGPIVINVNDGEVFGKSFPLQLQVRLELSGNLPSTAIVSLRILSPHLYLFSDGSHKKQYILPMTNKNMTVLLDFEIKNVTYYEDNQPVFDVGLDTWEQSIGESIKDSDYGRIAVTLKRNVKLIFKKLS